jgi:Ca2+-binding RTX toxin-like protein
VVAITRNGGSYALLASVSVNPGADALRRLSAATGKAATLTRTTLTGQSRDLERFTRQVASEAEPLAALETTRGLARSQDISQAVSEALKAAQLRFGGVEARNSQRPSTAGGAASGAAIASIIGEALANDEDAFDFSALIVRASSSRVKPSQVAITAGRQDQPDPYDRSIPLTAAVGGRATLDVKRGSLTAETFDIAIDRSNAGFGTIRGLGYRVSGTANPGNDGFVVNTSTGAADDTVILDTRDPTEEDSRLSYITLDTGAGSDVVFVAGNNLSRIDAGEGDDYVAAEGEATVSGGAGDDLIFARTAFGDEGDDVIFSNGFASGGDGDDSITLFTLDEESGESAIAFGGAGDDQIVASVQANVDGGDGADAIILRAGGSAAGGAGDDTISAFDRATLEGGEGNDDILLTRGGSVDGGAGDDNINARVYSEVTGGKGDDTISLDGGGVFTFRKGDGKDNVDISAVKLSPDDRNTGQVNRIVLDGFNHADLTLTVGALEFKAVPTGLNIAGDELNVRRSDVLGKLEVVFRKDGFEQVLRIDGLTQTLGPRVPVA